MKSLSTRCDAVVLYGLFALGLAVMFLFALVPHRASAAEVTLTTVTSTSTPVYTNTGLATTTRATTGDTVQYQLTLSGTPLIDPQINIFSMGSTTMSGSGANWYYSTTTASNWTESAVTFRISVGGTTGAEATTTVTQASLTGANVTFDKTGPTLSSVAWNDVDGSTEFSATDTLTLTFNETMATTTITSGNVDTTLALSGSHTFGTSPTVAWNTAGTVLTLTLGTSPTLATADTVDPTTAVKDAIGIADATAAPVTITDDVSPGNPTGLTDSTLKSSIRIILVSGGSTDIRYTTNGTTPTCSVGTSYSDSGEFTISETSTLKAIGCDDAGNYSSVVSAVYTITSGSGGSSGGGAGRAATPAVPASRASGLSSSQITSVLNVLTSFGADSATIAKVQAALARASSNGSVTNAGVGVFTSNLQVGSIGSEVKLLQQFLNAHGYPVATSGPGSAGNETATFGGATKAALIKYQKAKGITPAVGYFGPVTRAAANAE